MRLSPARVLTLSVLVLLLMTAMTAVRVVRKRPAVKSGGDDLQSDADARVDRNVHTGDPASGEVVRARQKSAAAVWLLSENPKTRTIDVCIPTGLYACV